MPSRSRTFQRPSRPALKRSVATAVPDASATGRQRAREPGAAMHSAGRASPVRHASLMATVTVFPRRTLAGTLSANRCRHDGVRTEYAPV